MSQKFFRIRNTLHVQPGDKVKSYTMVLGDVSPNRMPFSITPSGRISNMVPYKKVVVEGIVQEDGTVRLSDGMTVCLDNCFI